MQNILVVGGAGFIGSYVNKLLHCEGFNTLVLDNLSTGNRQAATRGIFLEGDSGDAALLHKIFTEHSIQGVMHFAACIDVGESVEHPLKYYANNVCATLTLLNTMVKHNVKIFIFSSTAAIFGVPQETFITERHPTLPINPYGKTKLAVEGLLEDLDRAHQLKSACLRYFNAAGGDPEGEVKCLKKKESNLIPLILKSLKYGDGTVHLFGDDYPTPDGTCIRDYIHIHDLATAHIAAMKHLLNGGPSMRYNLGNGKGHSVREVIDAAHRITGRAPKVRIGPRRPGDPPYLLADSQKARSELNWIPRYPKLENMIEHAWSALNN